MQKILFIALQAAFYTFVLIFGLIAESGNAGWFNGIWSAALVAPSAALLLSLAWYALMPRLKRKAVIYGFAFVLPAALCWLGWFLALLWYGSEWSQLLPHAFYISAFIGLWSLLLCAAYRKMTAEERNTRRTQSHAD